VPTTVTNANGIGQSYTPPAIQPVRKKYGTASRHMLDIYRPTSGGPFPFFVFTHSGAWQLNDLTYVPNILLHQLLNGWAVVSVGYRLAPATKWPSQLWDLRYALRWLRTYGARFNLNTSRIILSGESAGGHIALMHALQYPSQSRGTFCLTPVSNLNTFAAVSGTNEGWVADLMGTGNRTAASPITYANSTKKPIFLVHGDADTLNPVADSRTLRDALDKPGNAQHVYYQEISGWGHLDTSSQVNNTTFQSWLSGVNAGTIT
jgi:acetyl esterase/lipase